MGARSERDVRKLDENLQVLRKRTRADFHDEESWLRYINELGRVQKGLDALAAIDTDATKYRKEAVRGATALLMEFPELEVGVEDNLVQKVRGLEIGWIWSSDNGGGTHEGYVLLLPEEKERNEPARLVRCNARMFFPQGFGFPYPEWNSRQELDEIYARWSGTAIHEIYQQLLPKELRDE